MFWGPNEEGTDLSPKCQSARIQRNSLTLKQDKAQVTEEEFIYQLLYNTLAQDFEHPSIYYLTVSLGPEFWAWLCLLFFTLRLSSLKTAIQLSAMVVI